MSLTHSKPAPTGTMTYEEFLDWADEDRLAEWVDGQVIMASPANPKHQLLVLFLAKILSTYVDFQRLGVVFIPPLQMKLPKSSGREPDVAFVAQAHLDRVTQTHLDGPADLVVEVISPDSIKRDRETKFGEYQQGGIPEYWILDPNEEQVDFYQLDAQGVYQRVAPDAQGSYRSQAVPGFWLQAAWLWQVPLPDAEDVLLDVIGKPYADYRRERMKQRGL